MLVRWLISVDKVNAASIRPYNYMNYGAINYRQSLFGSYDLNANGISC